MKPRALRLWSFSGKNGASPAALVLAALVLLASGSARADCVTPAGVAGDMVYNTDSSVMQFCDGANWIGMAGGSASPGGGGGSGITALTGDISASGSGSVAASIVTGAVTYAKIQNTAAASVLLGRGAGSGAGTLQEITLGSGLSMTGTTLSATGALSGAGAAGYVPYWSGTSALSYDNTAGGQFFWDSTNHRLGIGTAAPSSSLQVANGNICATNAAGSVSYFCATNSASNGQIFLQSSSGSGHTVHIDTNGNSYFNGGNVGIGTTTPASHVHLYSSANAANTLAIDTAGTGNAQQSTLDLVTLGGGTSALGNAAYKGWSMFGRSNALATTAEQNDFGMAYWNGTTWRIDLSADSLTGNVGIGTTTPATRFHVSGPGDETISIETTGGTANLWQLQTSGTDGGKFRIIDAPSSVRMVIDTSGNLGIGTTTPQALLDVAGGVRHGADAACSAAKAGMLAWNSNTLQLCDNTGSWVNLASSSGVSGGTPRLSAITAAIAANTIANSDYAQVWNWTLTTAAKSGITFGETVAATNGAGAQSLVKINTLASSTAVPLMVTNLGNGASFRVNDETGDADATPFIIDASGNVGIGTTTPAGKLDVNNYGDIYFSRFSADVFSSALNFRKSRSATVGAHTIVQANDALSEINTFGSDGTTYLSAAGMKVEVDGTPGAGDMPGRFVFFTTPDGASVGVERMRITSGGNVGIGTATPSYPLDVVGSLRLSNTATWPIIYVDGSASTGDRPGVFLLRNSRAGAQLQSGDAIGLLSFRSSVQGISAEVASAATATHTTTSTPGNLMFRTTPTGSMNPVDRMTITEGGDVGIGTATPARPLDVVSGSVLQARFKGTGTASGGIVIDNAAGNLQSSIYFFSGGVNRWQIGGQSDNSNFFIWDSINARQVSFSSSGAWGIPGCMTYNGGTTGTCLSDERLKKNVAPFTLGLKEVVGLNPVTYQYNGLAGNPDDGNVKTGLIAQETVKVAPALVHETFEKLHPDDAEKTKLFEINYGDLTFGLINAVKELKGLFDSHDAEIKALKAENAALKVRLDDMDARLKKLDATVPATVH